MKKQSWIFVLLLAFMLQKATITTAHESGNNVIRIAPVSLFYGGIGGSLSYERFIDKNQKVSFYLPVHAGIRSYYIGPIPQSGADNDNYSVMIQPGIRMYPKGSNRKINFAMGASAFFTYGSENGYKGEITGLSSYVQYDKGSEMRIGTTLSPSFTAHITPKFNVGLEAFVGVSFYNKFTSNLPGVPKTGPLREMGGITFQLGYKI